MKRGGYIEIRTRLKPRRAKPRRSHAIKDEKRKQWCREQPCCARHLGIQTGYYCMGPSEPHHASDDRGMGQKAGDDSVIAMCHVHHRQIEDVNGAFKGWRKPQLRAWQDNEIQKAQKAYAARAASERRAA